MSEPVWAGQALAIVPTYNERENITRLVTELRGLPGNVRVLVVDDASPDGTGALVDALAAADPGVEVIHRSGKLGLGTAYKAGFAHGLANQYATISARWMQISATIRRACRPCWMRLRPGRTWWWAAAMCRAAGSWAGRAFAS